MGKSESSDYLTKLKARSLVKQIVEKQDSCAAKRTSFVEIGLKKVLDAFIAEKVGSQHFSSSTGYAHDNQGRKIVDRVFARVLDAESAAVRMQFVSGTHAIATALFGVLRPGDCLLSITGKPYDSLEIWIKVVLGYSYGC